MCTDSTDHDIKLYRVLQICRKRISDLTKTNIISDAQVSLSLKKSYQGMGCRPTHANCKCLQKCHHPNKKLATIPFMISANTQWQHQIYVSCQED